MKVIGAGYGRTGTKSLQLALERLGYDPCYHMESLLRNPQGVEYWQKAYEGKPVSWDGLFKNYQAVVDFPASMYYKELAAFYPEAKVVLSVRDPEKWYDSVKSTIYSFDPGVAIKLKLLMAMPFSSKARNLFKVIQLNDKSIWKKYFKGEFENRSFAIEKFNNHIKEVKAIIPSERLLIYEVGSGWEPLCAFLEKEIPGSPYPFTNKKDNFHNWATQIVKEVLS